MSGEVETEIDIKAEADDSEDDPDIPDESVAVKVEPDFVHLSTDEDDTDSTAAHPAVEITPQTGATRSQNISNPFDNKWSQVSSEKLREINARTTSENNRDAASGIGAIKHNFSFAYQKQPGRKQLQEEKQAEAEANKGPLPNITLDVLKEENSLIYDYLNIASGLEFSPRLRYLLSKSDDEIYLSVSNKEPDMYLQFRTNLTLIVRSTGKDLLCTLYNYKHQVFKSIIIRNFQECKQTVTTRTGIFLVLKELQRNRYSVCAGAFAEDDMMGMEFTEEFVKMVLIEKFEGSIVYRHRDCFTLIPRRRMSHHAGVGTSSCESCLQLKSEILIRRAQQLTAMQENAEANENSILATESHTVFESENYQNENNGYEQNNEYEQNMDTSFSEDVEIDIEPAIQKSGSRVSKAKTTYKKLIYTALQNAPRKQLLLRDMVNWILERYPQFQNKTSFENSIRHNLSLSPLFTQIQRTGAEDFGKGKYWTIDFTKKQDIKNMESSPLPGLNCELLNRGKNVLTKLVSIAPKPLQITSVISASRPSAQDLADSMEEDGVDPLEKDTDVSDALKALPSEYKDQLKKGLPVILRPINTGLMPGLSPKGGSSPNQGMKVITASSISGTTQPTFKILNKVSAIKVLNQTGNNISLQSSSGNNISLQNTSGNTSSLKLVNTSSLQQQTNSVASPILLTKFKSGTSGNPGVILSSGNQSSVITSSRVGGQIVLQQSSQNGVGGVKRVLLSRNSVLTPKIAPKPISEGSSTATLSTITLDDSQDSDDITEIPSTASSPSTRSSRSRSKSPTKSIVHGVPSTTFKSSVSNKEFPMPPFTIVDLIMISIFYSPERELGVAEICDYIRLFFPYYRQNYRQLSTSEFSKTVRETLKDKNKIFTMVFRSGSESYLFSFYESAQEWQDLIISDKWFKTPVDADLFRHMSANCEIFNKKVQSIRTKLVPVTYTAGESSKVNKSSEVLENDAVTVEDINDQDQSDEEESPEVIEGSFEEDLDKSTEDANSDYSEELLNRTIRRNDLYTILKKSFLHKPFKAKASSKLLTEQGFDKKIVTNFMVQFKKRFLKVKKNLFQFEKTNKEWLEKIIQVGTEGPPRKRLRLSEPDEQNPDPDLQNIEPDGLLADTNTASSDILDIKEETYDLDLDNLLSTTPADAFDDIDTDIVEEDPLAS